MWGKAQSFGRSQAFLEWLLVLFDLKHGDQWIVIWLTRPSSIQLCLSVLAPIPIPYYFSLYTQCQYTNCNYHHFGCALSPSCLARLNFFFFFKFSSGISSLGKLYYFLISSISHYNKLSGLWQHRFILYIWCLMSSDWTQIEMLIQLPSFPEGLGANSSFAFLRFQRLCTLLGPQHPPPSLPSITVWVLFTFHLFLTRPFTFKDLSDYIKPICIIQDNLHTLNLVD